MALPPPPLMEDMVSEILLRLPSEEPATLFRAAAVSRTWNGLISSEGALRRYREHKGIPPLMGFFQSQEYRMDPRPRFVPTTDWKPPFFSPDFLDDDSIILDCRHGRVLAHIVNPLSLVVWDPITGHREDVLFPVDHGIHLEFSDFTAAVLCAEEACDHLDCAKGPFRLVFAAADNDGVEDEDDVWVSVYSSGTGAWTDPVTVHPGDVSEAIPMGPGLLLGDSLYLPLDLGARRAFLVYDLAQNTLVILDGPPMGGRGMALVAVDNGLRVATTNVEGKDLQIWSLGDDGAWMPVRVIESVVPCAFGFAEIHVVGYAYGVDLAFLATNSGVWVVDLESGKARKVSNLACVNPVLPYTTFFTRGLGAN